MPKDISKILETQIEEQLLEAVYYNLNDLANKLRVNNFAYAMRSLLDLFLDRVSPESEVKKCSWYAPPTAEQISNGAKEVNLKKKIKYAIQGGLPEDDNLVIELNISNEIKNLNDLHRKLSGYTHINQSTFDIDNSKQNQFIKEIEQIVTDFTDSFIEIRQSILERADVDYIEGLITDSFIMDFHEELSLISVGEISSSEVKRHNVLKITAEHILINVEGHIYCVHQLGGKRDSVEINGDHPFSAKFNVNISNNKIYLEPNSFRFDLSSWYGEDIYPEKTS